jgi:hypothetical protein
MSAMSDADLRSYNSDRWSPQVHTNDVPLLLKSLERYKKLHKVCTENDLLQVITPENETIQVGFESISNSLLQQRDSVYSFIRRKRDSSTKMFEFYSSGNDLASKTMADIDLKFTQSADILVDYRPISMSDDSPWIAKGLEKLDKVILFAVEQVKNKAKYHQDEARRLMGSYK